MTSKNQGLQLFIDIKIFGNRKNVSFFSGRNFSSPDSDPHNPNMIEVEIRIGNSAHNTQYLPGEMLAGGHAGHLSEPGGQVGEGLEHGLQEGDQVHEPG
jgi:hypothetical protein